MISHQFESFECKARLAWIEKFIGPPTQDQWELMNRIRSRSRPSFEELLKRMQDNDTVKEADEFHQFPRVIDDTGWIPQSNEVDSPKSRSSGITQPTILDAPTGPFMPEISITYSYQQESSMSEFTRPKKGMDHYIYYPNTMVGMLAEEYLRALIRELTNDRSGGKDEEVGFISSDPSSFIIPVAGLIDELHWYIDPDNKDLEPMEYFVHLKGSNCFTQITQGVKEYYKDNPNLNRINWDSLSRWAAQMDLFVVTDDDWLTMLAWYEDNNIDRNLTISNFLFTAKPDWINPTIIEENKVFDILRWEYWVVVKHGQVNERKRLAFLPISQIINDVNSATPSYKTTTWYCPVLYTTDPNASMLDNTPITIRNCQVLPDLWAVTIRIDRKYPGTSSIFPVLMTYLKEKDIEVTIQPDTGYLVANCPSIDWLGGLIVTY